MTLIAVGNASVDFGPTNIFKDVTFTVAQGERWAIVGRNGTGKTTLVRLLTGQLQPSKGNVARQPGLRIALLEQHRHFEPEMSLWDVVADAFAELRQLEVSLARQAANLEHDHGEAAMAKYGRDLERFEREGGYQLASTVDSVLMGVGFDPDHARATQIGTLSGGERGRVALARQLAMPAELLLLDEPTNHLDLETTAWLENYLTETQRTVICISHDRAFLAAMADHVLHFEGGSANAYAGNYESFITQREERRLTQVRQFDKQEKKVSAENEYIARNLAGQNTKQAKGRRKLLARMPRISPPPGSEAVMALRLNAGTRSGDRVLEAIHATIGVPGRDLIKDVTLVLERGDVVALLGANGAGKSTLIKTLLGEREPVKGEVKLGASTSVAYYRQDLAHLPLDANIYDVIADMRPLWERRQVQGHLGRFGFSGDEVQRTVGTLSGGERARVALALLTLESANLLVLDEPTNHLDVESIEAMEDAIEGYDGSVLVVSHDRAVLRGLATSVWEVKDKQLKQFDGSFVEWEQVRADAKAKIELDARAESAASAERSAKARAVANAAANAKAREHKAGEGKQQKGAHAGGGNNKGKSGASAVRPSAQGGDRKKLARAAQKAVADVELRVNTLEGRIAELATALEDLTLYDTPAGTRKAQELGRSLDEHRDLLDEAMFDWNVAAENAAAFEGV